LEQDWADPQAPQEQPAPRRRRGQVYAGWALGALVLLAVSAGAALALRHHSAAAKPLSCAQQYTAWFNGTGGAVLSSIGDDGQALSAAVGSKDIEILDRALKVFGKDAPAAEKQPLPACADPKAYSVQFFSSPT
jgi:hypothetical protein